MSTTTLNIDQILSFLQGSDEIRDKINIRKAYAPALDTVGKTTRIGDDCAAIENGADGYLLFSGEAILPQFVADDPWFAGYSAVMVNISDVCSMGGKPVAVLDMLWSPDLERIEPLWDGMRAAAKAYNVPIVGGHTTITRNDDPVYLSTSILGRANKLMTSFDAKAGQDIVMMAVDLNGTYRLDKPFWNSSVGTDPEKLRRNNTLLPQIAEQGWCDVCKDISNGGIIGTLILLLECSNVGATIDLELLPQPSDTDFQRWLISFPSFGFLFASSEQHTHSLIDCFNKHDVACRVIGEVIEEQELSLSLHGRSEVFWKNSRN